MRSVGYYFKSVFYPVVVSSSNRKYRIDILKPDSIDMNKLLKSSCYRPVDILYSIIYTKTTQVMYSYGVSYVFDNIVSFLSQEDQIAFLIGGNIPDKRVDGVELVSLGNQLTGGNSNRISKLDYKEPEKPTRVVYSGYLYRQISSDSIKSLDYFILNKDLKLDTKDYKTLDTYEKVQEYIDNVDWTKVEYTAKDTETTGLDFFYNYDNDLIVGMSHSYKDKQGVYIPFRYKGGLMLDTIRVFEIMKPAFDNTQQIFKNGDFDKRVFRSVGIEERIDCELDNLLHLVNPQKTASKALKPVAKMLLDEDTIELDEILGKNFDAKLVEWIDLDLITVYACADTDYTRRVFLKLYETLTEEEKLLYPFTNEGYSIISSANWWGLPMNIEQLDSMMSDGLKDKYNLEKLMLDYIYAGSATVEIKRILAKRGVDAKSLPQDKIEKLLNSEVFIKHMSELTKGSRKPVLELGYDADKEKILYKLLDYPRLRYTPSGALSTGKDYFRDIDVYVSDKDTNILKEDLLSVNGKEVIVSKSEVNSKVFPLAYMFMEYAKLDNKLNTYKRLKSKSKNGRTFSTYKYNGTETGRISNQVHIIPSYSKNVISIDDNSKWGLLIFDFDQIELRGVHNEALRLWETMKELPQVKNKPDHIVNTYDTTKVVDIFNSFFKDVHSEMTSQFMGIPVREVTKEQRSRGKAVNFGGVYGASSMTMARDALIKAKTKEQREQVLEEFAVAKNNWLNSNLHLWNYFNSMEGLALKEIPEDKIPFNIQSEHVGMTVARSGRKRLYNLEDLDSKKISHIQNAAKNQRIQSYCRDVYFLAIIMFERELRSKGFTEEDTHLFLTVHDEGGYLYNKEKINPEWLVANVFKCCCMELEGAPIKYYCTPAIVDNWLEGKSDKYEIPKEYLSSLSTDINDYSISDNLNHKEFMLSKITDYYRDKVLSIAKESLKRGSIALEDIDLDSNYYIMKKIGMYTVGSTNITKDKTLNNIVNLLSFRKDELEIDDIKLTYNGEEIDLDNIVHQEEGDIDFEEFDLTDEFNPFDEDEDQEYSSISRGDTTKSMINMKTLNELNSSYTNITLHEKKEAILHNIMVERFVNRATFILDKTAVGELKKDGFSKINNLLMEAEDGLGFEVYYMKSGDIIPANIRLPLQFKYDKFDKFIDLLRS